MPIGSSAPGKMGSPSDTKIGSDESRVSESSGSGPDEGEPSSPTVLKNQDEQEGEEENEMPPREAIMEQRATLPRPSEVQDDRVYMVTLISGNRIPMLGADMKEVLTTPRAPEGLSQNGSSGSGSGGSSGDGRKWWQDVLLGIGQIGNIYLEDYLEGQDDLTEEEREMLREIAEQRRKEREKRERRNTYLMIGGLVVAGGGLLYYLSQRGSGSSSSSPSGSSGGRSASGGGSSSSTSSQPADVEVGGTRTNESPPESSSPSGSPGGQGGDPSPSPEKNPPSEPAPEEGETRQGENRPNENPPSGGSATPDFKPAFDE